MSAQPTRNTPSPSITPRTSCAVTGTQSAQGPQGPQDSRSIPRSSLLRSGIALGAGAVGAAIVCIGAVGTHATGADAGAAPVGPAPLAPAARPALPEDWEDTVLTQDLPSERDGYIASFTTLYIDGPVKSVSAKRIAGADGIVNFMPQGTDSQSEGFTPHVSGPARLDGDPVTLLLLGDAGSEVWAEVQLVRTANPGARALLLHVLGSSGWSIALPKGTPIVGDLIQKDSPGLVSKKDARSALANGVSMSFHPDGDNPARMDHVQVLDGGQHITGGVSHPVSGDRVHHDWYGTAVGGDGGWFYLCAQLPDES
ncbi:hypothetical protein [Brachybacterium sp. ACRRE]|uniref:hypothetical protein n=1 Tax=Brachybacterium sp. ACRRE TaxID=2918184 RepID=UPI001EF22479|nr:hypothetical protein [Brachybacterium sp. ACRRE]MCG7309067.1 hypothetical protein [Brachybacterium sp. ACRRE]